MQLFQANTFNVMLALVIIFFARFYVKNFRKLQFFQMVNPHSLQCPNYFA
jgi:hypothetical protein